MAQRERHGLITRKFTLYYMQIRAANTRIRNLNQNIIVFLNFRYRNFNQRQFLVFRGILEGFHVE